MFYSKKYIKLYEKAKKLSWYVIFIAYNESFIFLKNLYEAAILALVKILKFKE